MVELTVCTHFTSIYSYHEFIKPNPKVKKRFLYLYMYVKTDVDDADRNFTDDLCITIYLIEMFK